MVGLWKKPFGKAKALEFEKKKGIAWYIDTSSVVCTLKYNRKLVNQIARLVAIVEKSHITIAVRPTNRNRSNTMWVLRLQS